MEKRKHEASISNYYSKTKSGTHITSDREALAEFLSFSRQKLIARVKDRDMLYIFAWLLGVPIGVLLLLWILSYVIH